MLRKEHTCKTNEISLSHMYFWVYGKSVLHESVDPWVKDDARAAVYTVNLANTPFTLGHGSHVSGHRCRTSAKRD